MSTEKIRSKKVDKPAKNHLWRNTERLKLVWARDKNEVKKKANYKYYKVMKKLQVYNVKEYLKENPNL